MSEFLCWKHGIPLRRRYLMTRGLVNTCIKCEEEQVIKKLLKESLPNESLLTMFGDDYNTSEANGQ